MGKKGASHDEQSPDEPVVRAISQNDESLQKAYRQAAETLPHFIEWIERGGKAIHSAKLRFRDPDFSAEMGEDRFLFMWLTTVQYHREEGFFSGVFFEVPKEMQKWHQVGERLGFEGEDVFDWMVLEDGHLYGGFTLRATRDGLPEAERAEYDRYIGVTVYEPVA
jgi:uncharacterized protein YegJ (DUF2314 family)